MIAHGAKHAWLQIPKGNVVGEPADVQFGVVITVRIAAIDEHMFSPVAPLVGQRYGLIVEQKVRVLNPRPIANAIRFTPAGLRPASKKGTKPV
jgi:hypothetical protein